MNVTKVTKEDIIRIKPGKQEIFVCENALAARNGQALVLNYVNKYFRPIEVKRYATKVSENVLSVTAIEA